LLSNALPEPRTVMVQLFNANIAVVAMLSLPLLDNLALRTIPNSSLRLRPPILLVVSLLQFTSVQYRELRRGNARIGKEQVGVEVNGQAVHSDRQQVHIPTALR